MEEVLAKRIRPRAAAILLLALDLAGTFLFGIEGALSAIKGHLDLFGAMVLSFCTALGGGIIRDVLIGETPPGSIRDWHYGVVAFAGGATAVFFYHFVQEIPAPLLTTLDAAGLALFSVAGAAKAMDYKINSFIAILLGTITGVGGGTVRDILLAQVPTVLRVDVYATAAMLGAVVMVAAVKLRCPPRVAALLGAGAYFGLRMIAVQRHWSLPALNAQ